MTSGPAHITSRDNPMLVRLRKATRHAGDYRKTGQVLLEGEHLCRAWWERGGARPLQALVAESAWQGGRFADLSKSAMATLIVDDDLMGELGQLESPAALAFVVTLPSPAVLDPFAPCVVLDRIQDAGNVGSILRSASAFGFAQVIALRGTAALWSPKALRAGMGAHFALGLVEGADEADLAALQVPLLGTSSHASELLHAAPLPWPCAWVFGNEGAGLSPALAARCSLHVRVPQPGGEESLNVAAAAAVCLYESACGRAA